MNYTIDASTEALRSALEGTIALLESVERDTYYGIHDEYEPRDKCTCELCKARAVLSGIPPPSTEGLRGALERCERAMKPFAARVYNDNHDITVTDTYRLGIEEYTAIYFAHKAARTALSSSPPEGLRGWRDIETAPKDGTEILTFSDRMGLGTMVLYWADGYWREKTNGLGLKYGPTHWMPLLPAPDAARTALAGSAGGRIKVTARGVSIRVHTWALAELASEMAGPGAEIRYVPEGSDDGWCVWTEGETWPDEDDFRYRLFALEVKRLRRERHSLAPSAGVTAPETNGD